jgi:hypothetical protein
MDERHNIRIVTTHAGPAWVVEKTNVTREQVDAAIESARFLAPRGATVTPTVTTR